ncbi:MAG: tetratricopeptide repeat protein, partial [Deltaproteobacteria bacterium]
YADRGDTAKAEAAYRKAIELDPEFLPARINLAGMQEAAGDLALAIQTCEEISDLVPNNQLVHSKLAYLYTKTGNLDAALSHYQYLLDTAPQFDEEIALKIGLLYFEQENFADAEILLRRITGENPGNQHAHYYLGHTLVKTLKPEEAAQAFQAVKTDSDLFPQARIQLAFIYSQAGDMHGAQQVIQETIALRPDDVSLYHALAIVHAEKKDYQSAIAALQKAIEHDSASEDLLLYLGHLYEKAGMFNESIAAMREVLAINSNNADALNFIGYLYAERGIHLREARILIKKALAVKPDDGYILDSLGWVYYKMENYKKALTYLEQAQRLVPDDPTIAEHLGDVYTRLNKTGKALELYRRALELAPDKQAVQQKINDLEGL